MQSSQSFPSSFPTSTYCTADFASFVSAADILVPVREAIAIPATAQTPPLTSERRETPVCLSSSMSFHLDLEWVELSRCGCSVPHATTVIVPLIVSCPEPQKMSQRN